MLFYTTEGQFGEEDFVVTARGLFLLDIGTATYTEYDPGDPEVIKFLVANPETLAMKKGHIHSHNNMGVFFSSTDDNELIDNCGFHNFYLSLIVNNKNEMCAKIAFKAKTSSENKITMTFMDQNGKEKQKNITGKKESESIYTYKCQILKTTEAVEDSFTSRFQEVKKTKDDRDAKKTTGSATYGGPRSKDWYNGQEWRQAGLFDDTKGAATTPKGSKIYSAELFSPGLVGRNAPMKSDPKVRDMLAKLVSMDLLYEGTLGGALKKMSSEFYPAEEEYPTHKDPFAPHVYYDAVEKRALDFYMSSFPEDVTYLKFFSETMQNCIEILEFYEEDFPELVANLTEAINLEIR
jgi:membrane-associated HD superfamily phosphohydrolase